MTPTAPQLNALAAKIGAFLASIVPTGTPVIQGPVNRVPAPKDSHVMFSFLFERRIRTNVVSYATFAPDQGFRQVEQGTEVHVQFDFYAAGAEGNQQVVGSWAAAVSTLWRDEYGCDALAPDAAPLFIDDARGIPLISGEDQYVGRFTCTAVLQYNPVTSVPQQFADEAQVSLVLANQLES